MFLGQILGLGPIWYIESMLSPVLCITFQNTKGMPFGAAPATQAIASGAGVRVVTGSPTLHSVLQGNFKTPVTLLDCVEFHGVLKNFS